MTKFLDMFTPIRKGNFGLTEEAIYKSIQHGGRFIPVYGGTQQHVTTDRFASEYGKTKHDKSITIFNGTGIIVSLDGSSGSMTFIDSNDGFALNHHAGFFQLREDAREVVVPEFFALFFEKQLQEASVSKGSKTLTLNTLQSMDFDLPEYETQKKIMAKILPILQIKSKANGILSKISSLKERIPSLEHSHYQAKDIPISDVLDCYGGNTGLTEKEIYQRILEEGQRYEVLSASTSEATRLGDIPKCNLHGNELEVLDDKEGILVIRKGKAGIVYYRPKGKYTLTDDAYFLTVKEDCEYDISLKWVIAQYRQAFAEYSSSSDNGTWNMTGFFKNVQIDIPCLEEQLEIAKRYDYLESLQIAIEDILLKVDHLFARQIVS